MEEDILDLIRSYMPEAKIELSPHFSGSYKIRLPGAVNEKSGYEELRKALKESAAKPMCTTCHQRHTKFRYFDNNSSSVLQARYKCLNCNNYFTLGGKQYSKDQNIIARDPSSIADRTRRLRHFREIAEAEIENVEAERMRQRAKRGSEIENIEAKRMRPWPMPTSKTGGMIGSNIGNQDPSFHAFSGAHQSAVPTYTRHNFFEQQQQERLRQFQQQIAYGTQYLQSNLPPTTEGNFLQFSSSSGVTGFNTTSYPSGTFPLVKNMELSPQLPAEQSKAASTEVTPTSNIDPSFSDELQKKYVQWIQSQEGLQALSLPYMPPARIGNVSSDYSTSISGSSTFDTQTAGHITDQPNNDKDNNQVDNHLTALLASPSIECYTNISELLTKSKTE